MKRFTFLRSTRSVSSNIGSPSGSSVSSGQGHGCEDEAGVPNGRSKLSLRVDISDGTAVSAVPSAESQCGTSNGQPELDISISTDSHVLDVSRLSSPGMVACDKCDSLARRVATLTAERAQRDKVINELRGELFRIQAASPVGSGDKDSDLVGVLQHELSNAKVQLANTAWQWESKLVEIRRKHEAELDELKSKLKSKTDDYNRVLSARDNFASKLTDVQGTVRILRLENDLLRVENYGLKAHTGSAISPTSRRGSDEQGDEFPSTQMSVREPGGGRRWAMDLGMTLEEWGDAVAPSLPVLVDAHPSPKPPLPGQRPRHRHASSEPQLARKLLEAGMVVLDGSSETVGTLHLETAPPRDMPSIIKAFTALPLLQSLTPYERNTVALGFRRHVFSSGETINDTNSRLVQHGTGGLLVVGQGAVAITCDAALSNTSDRKLHPGDVFVLDSGQNLTCTALGDAVCYWLPKDDLFRMLCDVVANRTLAHSASSPEAGSSFHSLPKFGAVQPSPHLAGTQASPSRRFRRKAASCRTAVEQCVDHESYVAVLEKYQTAFSSIALPSGRGIVTIDEIDQAKKDFSREISVMVNGKLLPMGTPGRFVEFIHTLASVVTTILFQLEFTPDIQEAVDLCWKIDTPVPEASKPAGIFPPPAPMGPIMTRNQSEDAPARRRRRSGNRRFSRIDALSDSEVGVGIAAARRRSSITAGSPLTPNRHVGERKNSFHSDIETEEFQEKMPAFASSDSTGSGPKRSRPVVVSLPARGGVPLRRVPVPAPIVITDGSHTPHDANTQPASSPLATRISAAMAHAICSVVADTVVAACRTVTGGDSYAQSNFLFGCPGLVVIAAESGPSSPSEITVTPNSIRVSSVNTYRVCHLGDVDFADPQLWALLRTSINETIKLTTASQIKESLALQCATDLAAASTASLLSCRSDGGSSSLLRGPKILAVALVSGSNTPLSLPGSKSANQRGFSDSESDAGAMDEEEEKRRPGSLVDDSDDSSWSSSPAYSLTGSTAGYKRIGTSSPRRSPKSSWHASNLSTIPAGGSSAATEPSPKVVSYNAAAFFTSRDRFLSVLCHVVSQ